MTPDPEALAQRVAAAASEARAAGRYPDGLEAELDHHWRAATARPLDAHLLELRAALDALRATIPLHVPPVEASSRLPGGAAMHQAIGRAVSRQMTELVAQLDRFTDALDRTLEAVHAALPATPAHAEAFDVRLTALEQQVAALVKERR